MASGGGSDPPKQDVDKLNTIQFLSDGIAGFLHRAIQVKKQQTGLDDEQVCTLLDQEQEKLYGFQIYTSQPRQ
jgi:hypothetical protein